MRGREKLDGVFFSDLSLEIEALLKRWVGGIVGGRLLVVWE